MINKEGGRGRPTKMKKTVKTVKTVKPSKDKKSSKKGKKGSDKKKSKKEEKGFFGVVREMFFPPQEGGGDGHVPEGFRENLETGELEKFEMNGGGTKKQTTKKQTTKKPTTKKPTTKKPTTKKPTTKKPTTKKPTTKKPTKKTTMKKGGDLGVVASLIAPTGFETLATAAGLSWGAAALGDKVIKEKEEKKGGRNKVTISSRTKKI